MSEARQNPVLLLAEFDSPAALLEAAKRLSKEGYANFDAHSPFPIHGMDRAMRLTHSPLGWAVGIMALAGALGGYLLQVWATSVAYPLVVGGKPFNSFQAYVPIIFGLAVLSGALTAFIGMLILNRLPQYYHEVFSSDAFARFSRDGFFISFDLQKGAEDVKKIEQVLKSLQVRNMEYI